MTKPYQIDIFGVKVEPKEQQCPYCKKYLKTLDNRHLLHCHEYRKNLPVKQEKVLTVVDSVLKSTNLYLPKDVSYIRLPNGKILDFIFVDGVFVGFLFQLSDALGEKYQTTYRRYKRLSELLLAPQIYGISYKKKISRKRLISNFKNVLPVHSFPTGATLILLREDDMVFLSSKSTKSNTADLITKQLIDYFFKAKKWICDLIYKLGRCNNREFLFLCAWLRLGYALDEIEPQRWYRLPDTARRVDFRLKEGEIIVEIDAKELELHDPTRDKTTDRFFFQKGKIVIRFMNEEIDKNPLKCVRETINIAKRHGINITHQVLPTFIKGFVKKKEN